MIEIRYFALLSAILLTSFFSSPVNSVQRIVGGDEAISGSYPWMVSLQFTRPGSHFCGGTLISDRWVLSASHCYEEEPLDTIFAVIGDYDLSENDSGQKTVGIKQAIAAEGDLILFELLEPVSNTPISLSDDTFMSAINVGDLMTVAGWGNRSASEFVSDFPIRLHEVDVPLSNQASCISVYDTVGETVDDTMLCAGFSVGGKDSCQGDSGGPLFTYSTGVWYQTGVVSFGEGCAQANFPGVYTKISAYKAWIEQTIEREESLSINHLFLGRLGVSHVKRSTILLTNNQTDMVTINSVGLSGSSGFQVENDACSGVVLGNSESCDIVISAVFSSDGVKNTDLTVNTSDADRPSVTYGLSVFVMMEASYSQGFGGALDWYLEVDEEWRLNPSDSTELISDLESELYTVTMTHIEGAGTLRFDWQLESVSQMALTLFVDDKRVDTINVTQSYSSVEYVIESAGDHSVFWVLDENDWVSSSNIARLASVSFVKLGEEPEPEPEPEPELKLELELESYKDDSGSGGGLVIIPVALLILVYRLMTTIRRAYSV